MQKLNCWEHKKCGREFGGSKASELGACPAAIDAMFNGVHDGINAGRACWIIPGTMCNGQIQGDFSEKFMICGPCDFYSAVKSEEGRNFTPTVLLLARLDKEHLI